MAATLAPHPEGLWRGLETGGTGPVLRYRLYDLDRIISRTVAYGLLTVPLGLGYAAVVLGLGQLLGQDSSLVVAGATLAAELLAVADATMQPTQASLWLRPPAPPTAVHGPALGRLAAVVGDAS